MIQIKVNNEFLDLDPSTNVTFKKAQELNGIQNQYSYSNNFILKKTSKNVRLLGINYLPNSKAKSMTVGYKCDVVFNGCIFLKNQALKVQKESTDNIPIYLLFNDSNFVARAKEVTLNQLGLDPDYNKFTFELITKNEPSNIEFRAAPISAQDKSGLYVIEEMPILVNLKYFVQKICDKLSYSALGDFFTDTNIPEYYFTQNIGFYGSDASLKFDANLTCYDFLVSMLKTFNGYIDVSDSDKSIGIYLWKNIEGIKANFRDYSEYFTNYSEYSFSGGLAQKNLIGYSGSEPFYNSFFNNNKSVIDQSTYLTSDFGAGNLALFSDQEVNEVDGSIPARVVGETSEPKLMRLFKFESSKSDVVVYSSTLPQNLSLYKVYSPNILTIWQEFHQTYCSNIALPTVAVLDFRYNALMLSEFKMQQVFFIEQLSTYWLPLELNYSTEKNKISVKALMIEKTKVDVPNVFDFNVSMGFYESVTIDDINILYDIQNTSGASVFSTNSFNPLKNRIYVNGVEVTAAPANFDVSSEFNILIENIDPINNKDSDNLLFTFTSQEGGLSRTAKINIAHNGRASYTSEFPSETGVEKSYVVNNVNDFFAYINFCDAVVSPLNVPASFIPNVGNIPNPGFHDPSATTTAAMASQFKVLEVANKQNIKVTLSIGQARYTCSNRGGSAKAETRVKYDLFRNGAYLTTVHTGGVIDRYKTTSGQFIENNVLKTAYITLLPGDSLALGVSISGRKESAISSEMDGGIYLTNIKWKFECFEQL